MPTPEEVWRDASRNLNAVRKEALIAACEELGLGTSGTKPDLLARLDAHFSRRAAGAPRRAASAPVGAVDERSAPEAIYRAASANLDAVLKGVLISACERLHLSKSGTKGRSALAA